jgi:DNA-binding beta-propeller fold protein YncE
MNYRFLVFTAIVTTATLAGCGASEPPIGASAAIPQSNAIRHAQGPMELAYSRQSAKKQWFLYLGNMEGSLSKFKVYPLGGSRPIRSFSRSWNVYAIAIDPWNDVYTTNAFVSDTEITAYTPGGKAVLLNFGNGFGAPMGLAFDKQGNLWVADTVNIEEYAARSAKLLRIVKVRGCYSLATDSSDKVYVACGGYPRKGKIEVFAPRARRPFRVITQGIDRASALMFDRSGNLFVANCSPCYSYGKKQGGSITVYAPGSGVPSRTITDGIDWPIAMAFDGDDKLAVLNSPLYQKGSVTVYGSASHPTQTITKGIGSPTAIAVDPSGNVYVANLPVAGGKGYSITVYGAGGSLLRTITDGVAVPTALAIGSE